MFGRYCIQQGPGVRVMRVAQHLLRWPLLHRHAVAQHQYFIRQLRHYRQVMADDQQRVAAGLDFLQHFEDLRLHRGIQCGGRFIGDHQPRAQRQRAGNQRPLTQAAGQLIGTLPGTQPGLGHTDLSSNSITRSPRLRRSPQL